MGSKGRGGGGRGRGRASLSFNVEQLGLTPGEVLPEPVKQPPPLFPPLEYRPSPLLNDSSYKSQLQLKSDFLGYFKSNVSIYLNPPQHENVQFADAEQPKSTNTKFGVDWTFLPTELKPNASRKKRKTDTQVNIPKKVAKKYLTNLGTM